MPVHILGDITKPLLHLTPGQTSHTGDLMVQLILTAACRGLVHCQALKLCSSCGECESLLFAVQADNGFTDWQGRMGGGSSRGRRAQTAASSRSNSNKMSKAMPARQLNVLFGHDRMFSTSCRCMQH